MESLWDIPGFVPWATQVTMTVGDETLAWGTN